jgi:hypothetical protein
MNSKPLTNNLSWLLIGMALSLALGMKAAEAGTIESAVAKYHLVQDFPRLPQDGASVRSQAWRPIQRAMCLSFIVGSIRFWFPIIVGNFCVPLATVCSLPRTD